MVRWSVHIPRRLLYERTVPHLPPMMSIIFSNASSLGRQDHLKINSEHYDGGVCGIMDDLGFAWHKCPWIRLTSTGQCQSLG